MTVRKQHSSGPVRALAVIVAAGALATTLQAGTCTIDISSDQQTIDGFGFSSAWSGKLSDIKNNALYDTLGMSLLRIRIDPNKYWGDETANASAAHAYGAKVLGTPWSPPAYMKDNGNVVHGSLRTDQYGNYANYLKDAADSIGLDYVSVQNEPDWDPDYESCVWNGEQIRFFCRDYAQNIGKPVVMAESLNFNDDLTDPTLNDSVAASHVSIAGGHFYGNGNYVHANALYKGKHVWMTEHYIDNARSDMGNCMLIAKEISDAMNNWFSAYFWWWVADYDENANLVNSDGTIYKNGYTIGQFAKWIRPGSTRVSADYNPSDSVYVTAYRVNGETVIVAVNTGSGSVTQQFSIQNGTASSFSAYRTSGNESLANVGSIGVSSGSFSATLPGQSVTTFVQDSSSGTVANGTYKLVARHSGKAMDAYGGRTTNGTQIIQWSYGGGANQKWDVTDTGGGNYKIIGVQSGKALDIYAGDTANGTKVELWDFWGGPMQLFKFTATDSGYYRITPNCATGSCLDVSGISTADGAKVHLWQWVGGQNQQWAPQAP